MLNDDESQYESEVINNECPTRVNVTRSREPIKEFSSNNKIILSSFPSLFMLARGIFNKATLITNVIQHMMFQFNCRFAKCHRLIFLLFDQLQRHTVARIVSTRVKSDPVSMEKLGNIALSCSKVPFSKQARKAGIAKLEALTAYHGMQGLFLTISPDDAHDPNRIRMSLPQENIRDFPVRETEGFLEALKSGQSSFNSIPISSKNLRELLARGPVSAAEMFKIIIETLFSVVLPTPIH